MIVPVNRITPNISIKIHPPCKPDRISSNVPSSTWIIESVPIVTPEFSKTPACPYSKLLTILVSCADMLSAGSPKNPITTTPNSSQLIIVTMYRNRNSHIKCIEIYTDSIITILPQSLTKIKQYEIPDYPSRAEINPQPRNSRSSGRNWLLLASG